MARDSNLGINQTCATASWAAWGLVLNFVFLPSCCATIFFQVFIKELSFWEQSKNHWYLPSQRDSLTHEKAMVERVTRCL